MGSVIATGTQSCAPSNNKHFVLLISLVFLTLPGDGTSSARIWAALLSEVNECMGLQPLSKGLTAALLFWHPVLGHQDPALSTVVCFFSWP